MITIITCAFGGAGRGTANPEVSGGNPDPERARTRDLQHVSTAGHLAASEHPPQTPSASAEHTHTQELLEQPSVGFTSPISWSGLLHMAFEFCFHIEGVFFHPILHTHLQTRSRSRLYKNDFKLGDSTSGFHDVLHARARTLKVN